MINQLSPETLAWLHQAAAAGLAESMVLRHVMQRLEALEAAQQRFADHFRGAKEMVPTPEGAPVATDQDLLAIRSWLSHRPVLDSDLGEPGRQHGAAQPPGQPPAAQPTPPTATAEGLVERVVKAVGGADELPYSTARAAIREVAAWLDLVGWNRASNDLRKEVAE